MSRIDVFLHDVGVHPDDIPWNQTKELFLKEMDEGLNGRPSSLQMIPSFIGESFNPGKGECVAAVDAGGTNLRISNVRFNDDLQCEIAAFKQIPMPGSSGPVTAQEFFDQLAKHLDDILKETSKIGFCFSYPVEILPNRDGRVLSLNKEVVVEGIEGLLIGEQLQLALERRGARPAQQLCVLNDTTASLLGGRSIHSDSACYGTYLGFILGTGINCCYYEENTNIKKAGSLQGNQGKTIVNLESGFFNKMYRGELDARFVEKTLVAGDSWMEKMTSGQYLGPLMLEYLQSAANAGLFSDSAAAALLQLGRLSGKDIDDFLMNHVQGNLLADLKGLGPEDKKTAYLLADALFERAARLVSINLSACVQKSGGGTDPLKPALITVEGTTYYKAVMMRTKVEYYLQHYLARQEGLYFKTVQVSNAVTFGAALAAVCI